MEFLIPVNDFVLPASSMEFPVFANEISPPSAEENEPTPMTLLDQLNAAEGLAGPRSASCGVCPNAGRSQCNRCVTSDSSSCSSSNDWPCSLSAVSMQRSEIDLHLVLQAARNRPIAVLMYRIHKLFRYLAEVQETLPVWDLFFLSLQSFRGDETHRNSTSVCFTHSGC